MIKEEVDLNAIYNHLLAAENHGEFDIWISLSDDLDLYIFEGNSGNLTWAVYPVIDGNTQTLNVQALTASNWTEDEIDAAYRNSLTCNGCAAEIYYCECEVGAKQWSLNEKVPTWHPVEDSV